MGFTCKATCAPQKRLAAFLIIIIVVSTIVFCYSIFTKGKTQRKTPSIYHVNTVLANLEKRYRVKNENVGIIQDQNNSSDDLETTISTIVISNNSYYQDQNNSSDDLETTISTIVISNNPYYQTRLDDLLAKVKPTLHSSQNICEYTPEVRISLKNMFGTQAAAGIFTKYIQHLRTPFVFQLLPHLMNDQCSLKPAYHLKSHKEFADLVIGVPTVKRDSENYLLITLKYLIDGLDPDDRSTTLIVVMIGETDLEEVLEIARKIQTLFLRHVNDGLIEVISPRPQYYPDLDNLPQTLGDSEKRVKWRSKQNLDAMYLIAYCYSRGTYYLMLEDDVIATKNYAEAIRTFTETTSLSNPGWMFIDFCPVGGIGKLFKTSDLFGFMTYLQLFYADMPLDWLLESYLADKVCGNEKHSQKCVVAKEKARPRRKEPLFQHIGLYSSLKGKIQKVKNQKWMPAKNYFPHTNPPTSKLFTSIKEAAGHTLKNAYNGQTYFWGENPKKDDVVEFWFQEPILIKKYCFRSGNPNHIRDKFRHAIVEVLPARSEHNFSIVNTFDEFGIAEGELHVGPVNAMRLRLLKNNINWVVLSEIEIQTKKDENPG